MLGAIKQSEMFTSRPVLQSLITAAATAWVDEWFHWEEEIWWLFMANID